MKKLVRVVLIMIFFISLFLLSIILNINILTKKDNINTLASKIDYLDYVDVNSSSEDEIEDVYNDIYKTLSKNLNTKELEEFYNSKYLSDVTGNIIYNEVNYLLYNKKYQSVTTDNLNKKVNFKNDLLDAEVKRVNHDFVTSSNLLRYKTDSTSVKKVSLLRFLFKPSMKVILLTLIILSIIMAYFTGKTDILKMIFIPTSICGLLEIFMALFLNMYLDTLSKNRFIIDFLTPFVSYFTNTLFITGIILLLVSVIYLIINEVIEKNMKIIIKPRLKKVKSVK